MFSALRHAKRFSEDQSRFYGAQIVMALEYLQNLNIIYRCVTRRCLLLSTRGWLIVAMKDLLVRCCHASARLCHRRLRW
jgi:protein kinase A